MRKAGDDQADPSRHVTHVDLRVPEHVRIDGRLLRRPFQAPEDAILQPALPELEIENVSGPIGRSAVARPAVV